jgi:hypothetical protein
MIIIDTLAAATSRRLKQNAAGPMAAIANPLRRLAQ